MKILIALLILLSVATVSHSDELKDYRFENIPVSKMLKKYEAITGKCVDLVEGEHDPITIVAYNVSDNFLANQIESALEERSLKLFKICDNRYVATWIDPSPWLRYPPNVRPVVQYFDSLINNDIKQFKSIPISTLLIRNYQITWRRPSVKSELISSVNMEK